MTINSRLGDYELITDESGGSKITIRHVPTGKEFDINEDKLENVEQLSSVHGDITDSLEIGMNGGILTSVVWADDGNFYSAAQDAIDAASDFVRLGAGTFDPITITTNGLTVKGIGRGTVIDGGTTDSAIRIQASDVTVEKLDAQTDSGAGNTYYGVYGESGVKHIVEDVHVTDCDADGMHLTADETSVRGCYVAAGTGFGIGIDGSGIFVSGLRTSVIDNLVSGAGSDAIVVAEDDIRVIGNHADGNSGASVLVQSGVNDAIVSSNRAPRGVTDNGTGTTLSANDAT